MRKAYFYIITILFIASSCSNDISNIADGVVNSNTGIKEKILDINKISTIRLDSFVTSNGLYGDFNIEKISLGRYNDPYSGLTEASATFQVIPSASPSLPTNATLDSLVFEFSTTGEIWGDTLFDVNKKTFHLYQLKEVPYLDYDKDGILYNCQDIELDSIISTASFYSLHDNLNIAYFKIKDNLADTLFERAFNRRNDLDDIYNNDFTVDGVSSLNFLNFFKGLAIVPDSTVDNSIFNLDVESLKMVMHYSVEEHNQTIEFNVGNKQYKYNRIINTPIPSLSSLTANQREEVSFDSTNFALIQGMAGYLTKLILPHPDGLGRYRTIIKAQIEVKAEYYKEMPVAISPTIYCYATNELNEIKGALQNNATTPVIGYIDINSTDENDTKFIFDITELYEAYSNIPSDGEGLEILLSIPDDGVNAAGTSFNQVIIKEKPTIRIYYAEYK